MTTEVVAMEDYITSSTLAIAFLYMITIAIYVIRSAKGPTISDSVIAIDAISYNIVFLMVLFAMLFKVSFLASISVVLALWVYCLNIYVAKYLEVKEEMYE